MKLRPEIGRWLGLTRRPGAAAPSRAIRSVQCLPGVQTGNSITIGRDEVWVHLPRGIELRYEHAFNSVTDVLLWTGAFEEFEVDLMARMLTDGAVVVDVGANVGLFSVAAARTAPGVTVHAFEPLPATCQSLQANVARNGVAERVVINAVALSDRDGEAYITSDYHASNYLTDARSSQRKIAVRTRTLDSYAQDRRLSRLDFVKVDVEGRELSVLKGGMTTIRQFKPAVLVEIIEHDSRFHDRVVEARDEVVALMHGSGYTFQVVGDRRELLSPAEYRTYSSPQSYHNYLFTCREPH